MTLTHAELVKIAGKWLRSTAGCSVVVTELVPTLGQTPDALGFKSYLSYLIECKVSRSDFFADRKKVHQRKPHNSVGDYRWYLTPPALLTVDDLPEGWGLLEAHNSRVRVIRGTLRNQWGKPPPKAAPAHRFEKTDLYQERSILVSLARRALECLPADWTPPVWKAPVVAPSSICHDRYVCPPLGRAGQISFASVRDLADALGMYDAPPEGAQSLGEKGRD